MKSGPFAQAAGDGGPGPAAVELSALRVAIVDGDREFPPTLAGHMRELGWWLTVHPGPAAPSALESVSPHAVLVDIAILGPRWDDWLARHRARLPDVGLLVCTARSTLRQRVHGLSVAADDWIAKPCAPDELSARIYAVVRAHRQRARWKELKPVCSVGLEVRPELYDAVVDGRPALLTRREFDVLLCLARAEGDVMPRERVYREVWGANTAAGDRALDTAVRKIRAKLRRLAPERSYVHTHWGVGYRFGYERARGRR